MRDYPLLSGITRFFPHPIASLEVPRLESPSPEVFRIFSKTRTYPHLRAPSRSYPLQLCPFRAPNPHLSAPIRTNPLRTRTTHHAPRNPFQAHPTHLPSSPA